MNPSPGGEQCIDQKYLDEFHKVTLLHTAHCTAKNS